MKRICGYSLLSLLLSLFLSNKASSQEETQKKAIASVHPFWSPTSGSIVYYSIDSQKVLERG